MNSVSYFTYPSLCPSSTWNLMMERVPVEGINWSVPPTGLEGEEIQAAALQISKHVDSQIQNVGYTAGKILGGLISWNVLSRCVLPLTKPLTLCVRLSAPLCRAVQENALSFFKALTMSCGRASSIMQPAGFCSAGQLYSDSLKKARDILKNDLELNGVSPEEAADLAQKFRFIVTIPTHEETDNEGMVEAPCKQPPASPFSKRAQRRDL